MKFLTTGIAGLRTFADAADYIACEGVPTYRYRIWHSLFGYGISIHEDDFDASDWMTSGACVLFAH